MSDMEISRADIESLAAKLADLEPRLSVRERALLSTLFQIAGDAIGRSRPAPPPRLSAFMPQAQSLDAEESAALPSVHDQFLNAFSPGRDDQSTTVPDKIGNLQIKLSAAGDQESR